MSSQPARLLIVDDNTINSKLLSRLLAKQGYAISLAEGAQGLLERVRRDAVDLVLLDIDMPEISGLDGLRMLREVYSAIELPVIMVTAKDQSEDIVRALELGANDYLTKPIDFSVTLARIQTQLSLKRAEEALRESEERYALAARGANDGLWDWNLRADTLYLSRRWKAMLGYQENEIGEKPEEWFSRIHEVDRERVLGEIRAHQQGAAPLFESEHRMLHKDGSFRWMLSRGVAICDASGKPARMAGSQTDITEGKLSDPLTGLPNRLLLIDRLDRLIEHTRRHKQYLFAVLFIDLDDFKIINDSLGHVVGDQLLIAVTNRLQKCLRATDTVARIEKPVTMARLGGDEFAILLDDIQDPSDATRVAERILQQFASPFLSEREIFTSASIGIALSSSGYDAAQGLLRNAGTAANRAKSLGKGRYEMFDAEMRVTVMRRLQLETDLRRSIERGEFENFYQPIVFVDSGQVVGFEALLRWHHPTRGLVTPAEFVPVAEETGLICELGEWNLREACRQISIWNADAVSDSPLAVSVNLSAKQFLQPDLVDRIAGFLREFAIPPGILKLEITESTVMKNHATTAEMLIRMRSLGISISLDDFGTGYSSLSYLHRFPVDTLKIDRSFIIGLGKQGDSVEIVRTILSLANHLRLDVVAEGVETAEQLALLRELRCDYAQGYYFAKPLPAQHACALLGHAIHDA